jgi:hypothetical protein
MRGVTYIDSAAVHNTRFGIGGRLRGMGWPNRPQAMPSIAFIFITALSGVVSTGRPVASATFSAAGAKLYCASSIK